MAGWDRFLSERDKKHLETWGKKSSDALGLRPVLVIVDAYYASVGHERKPLEASVVDWPMSCGLEGWEAIDRIAVILKAARHAQIPVVYIRNSETFPTDPLRVGQRGGTSRTPNPLLAPDVRALANEIVHEIAPLADELILEKAAPSAFSGTMLLQYLQMKGADTVLFCGESTSGCIRASVVDAQTNRYRVGVVGDACYDRFEASHWISLFDMHQKYAEVLSCKDTEQYLHNLRISDGQ